MFTHSFYARRSQKRKEIDRLAVFFVHLRSSLKTLVKSTPDCKRNIIDSAAKVLLKVLCSDAEKRNKNKEL